MRRALALASTLALTLALALLVGCGGPSATPPPAPEPPASTAEADQLAAEYRAMVDGYNEQTGAPVILADALRTRLAADEQVVLLDIREAVEQDVSTLPGAIRLPPSQIDAIRADDPRFAGDKTIVTYCTAGLRSGYAAVTLSERLGKPVLNLDGGIVSWWNAGGEVVGKDGKPTDQVHAYGPEWARFLIQR